MVCKVVILSHIAAEKPKGNFLRLWWHRNLLDQAAKGMNKCSPVCQPRLHWCCFLDSFSTCLEYQSVACSGPKMIHLEPAFSVYNRTAPPPSVDAASTIDTLVPKWSCSFLSAIRRIRGGEVKGKKALKKWKLETITSIYLFLQRQIHLKYISNIYGLFKNTSLRDQESSLFSKAVSFPSQQLLSKNEKRENTTFRRVFAFIFSVFICHLQVHLLWFNDLTAYGKVQCTFYLSWEFSA